MGLPEWLPCSPGDLNAMLFGDQVELKEIPQKERLEFLKSVNESVVK
jgi:hypothetical protein